MDLRKLYKLDNPTWSHDIIPEIMDGHNIADFVDAEIEEKLKELEIEEEEMAQEWLKQVIVGLGFRVSCTIKPRF